MSKVLTSTDFVDQLAELGQTDFEISQSRGLPILEPTKRNKVRAELLEGLKTYLSSVLEDEDRAIANVYLTSEGVALEVENTTVGSKCGDDCNGMITMILDITFKNLTYDAYNEADIYAEDLEIKRQKEAAKAAEKAAKAAKAKASKTNNN